MQPAVRGRFARHSLVAELAFAEIHFMAKIPGETTKQMLIGALQNAQCALEDTPFAVLSEARQVSELKQAIRSKIAELQGPRTSLIAD
jgi:hypothetical protein